MANEKTVLTVEFPQELYEKAQKEAARLGISLAGFIRQLTVQYFEKK